MCCCQVVLITEFHCLSLASCSVYTKFIHSSKYWYIYKGQRDDNEHSILVIGFFLVRQLLRKQIAKRDFVLSLGESGWKVYFQHIRKVCVRSFVGSDNWIYSICFIYSVKEYEIQLDDDNIISFLRITVRSP